jgi:eukaryotic-like serine/threonine-protein kinase
VLVDAYVKAGRQAEAFKLIHQLVSDARKTWPKDSPQLGTALAVSGTALVELGSFGDAEPLLRESLAIRDKIQQDVWTTFNSKCLLGGALLGQKKYALAEPLLIAGYEGMKERESKIPPGGKVRLTESLGRLVQLYEATGKAEAAAKWRKELEARKMADRPPQKKP